LNELPVLNKKPATGKKLSNGYSLKNSYIGKKHQDPAETAFIFARDKHSCLILASTAYRYGW
jgi:phenylacetate-CoA ligase